METLRDEVVAFLESGAALEDVEGTVIESAQGLGDDERAPLWLFARSYRAREGQDRSRLPVLVSS